MELIRNNGAKSLPSYCMASNAMTCFPCPAMKAIQKKSIGPAEIRELRNA
jgi:hypothetical protein